MREYFNSIYDREWKWGNKPDPLLSYYLHLIPKGKALDLGMGDGRNVLFLAKQGFDVTGVDISKKAVKLADSLAKRFGIKIKSLCKDMREFKIKEGYYSLIISTGAALNFMKKSEAIRMLKNIKEGLKKGGFVYLSVFSTKDEFFKKLSKTKTPVEENTYYVKRMQGFVNYFTVKEIRRVFRDFELIFLLSGKEIDLHDKSHYHSMIYYMGKKI
jgi:cyclopropane fatty-acyl-phospholipid synthase-like methyltransferase